MSAQPCEGGVRQDADLLVTGYTEPPACSDIYARCPQDTDLRGWIVLVKGWIAYNDVLSDIIIGVLGHSRGHRAAGEGVPGYE